MAYFKFHKNTSNRPGAPREYDIATGTVIEKGEIVKLTAGLVVAIGDADQDDPYLGVAAESHDGATADGRQTGLKIRVYDDPGDIFALVPSDTITATGGSTTTFVDSSILPATNDVFNGGSLKIVSCAASSALNGKIVKISDFTGSGGTITLAETLTAALASGDTAYLCPGTRCRGQYGWDLNSDGTDIDWETSGGEALYFEGSDPDVFVTYWRLRLHLRGNDAAAK